MDKVQPLKSALTRERTIKGLHKLQKTFESFSITEKAIFLVCSAVFSLAVFSLLYKVSDSFMVDMPAHGGSLSEGIIGTPRFINPLLASSDADRDLSSLIYSGLLKAKSDGSFVTDLAQSYSVSEDGLTYSFTLRSDAVFHDGKPVTTDDVEFTISKAQDSALKSPRRVSWEGVTIQKKSTHEIDFVLKQPYAPFIGNLTMGILPKHVWQNLQSDQFPFSDYNINPVGSGPYKIDSINRGSDGIPVSYTLKANKKYALGEPFISKLQISFFTNDGALIKALQSHAIESASNLGPTAASQISSSTSIASSVTLLKAPFTRVFGIFFNQNNKEILAHKEVRKALDAAIDTKEIINNVLGGYATKTAGPLPASITNDDHGDSDEVNSAYASTTIAAMAKAGWKKNPLTGIYEIKPSKTAATSTLSFSLATANIPELTEAARHIEESWKNLGVGIDTKVFESSDLNQSVIRPRKYDAVLFGMVIGRNPDLYAFWHSSQRNDPGLNIAMYTNTKADNALEDMRKAINKDAFDVAYKKFSAEITTDTPAIFLWSPHFIYAKPAKLQGVVLGPITTPNDRFANVEEWYVDKERVWKVFAD